MMWMWKAPLQSSTGAFLAPAITNSCSSQAGDTSARPCPSQPGRAGREAGPCLTGSTGGARGAPCRDPGAVHICENCHGNCSTAGSFAAKPAQVPQRHLGGRGSERSTDNKGGGGGSMCWGCGDTPLSPCPAAEASMPYPKAAPGWLTGNFFSCCTSRPRVCPQEPPLGPNHQPRRSPSCKPRQRWCSGVKLQRHRAVTLGDGSVSGGFGLFLAWRSQDLVLLLLNSVLPKHSLLSDPGSSAQSWRFPHLVNERNQAVPRAPQGWDGITTIPPGGEVTRAWPRWGQLTGAGKGSNL